MPAWQAPSFDGEAAPRPGRLEELEWVSQVHEGKKRIAQVYLPAGYDDEAIAIGNDVVYGLAAGVWTQNIGRAMTMADKLQAGTVWINTYRAVSYLSPFGGYKHSGLGRESGKEMIKEYLQMKSVWIETSNAEAPNPFVLR